MLCAQRNARASLVPLLLLLILSFMSMHVCLPVGLSGNVRSLLLHHNIDCLTFRPHPQRKRNRRSSNNSGVSEKRKLNGRDVDRADARVTRSDLLFMLAGLLRISSNLHGERETHGLGATRGMRERKMDRE